MGTIYLIFFLCAKEYYIRNLLLLTRAVYSDTNKIESESFIACSTNYSSTKYSFNTRHSIYSGNCSTITSSFKSSKIKYMAELSSIFPLRNPLYIGGTSVNKFNYSTVALACAAEVQNKPQFVQSARELNNALGSNAIKSKMISP